MTFPPRILQSAVGLPTDDGDGNPVDHAVDLVAAARAGVLVHHRPAPVERPDVVLEIRRFTDPFVFEERWAVIAEYSGTIVSDFPTLEAARREYEDAGAQIGAAIYMGRA